MADEPNTGVQPGEQPGSGAPTPTPPAPPSSADDGPKFTQAQLDQMAGRRAAEAKRAAEREIAEKLGCTIDEAKAMLDERRNAEQQRMSEAERRERAAAEMEQRAEERERRAAARERTLILRDALVTAGVPVAKAAKAVALLDVPVDADVTDGTVVADAVEKFKTDFPELVGQPTPGNGLPSGVTGGNPPPGGSGNGPAGVAAAEERYRRERQASSAATDVLATIRPRAS